MQEVITFTSLSAWRADSFIPTGHLWNVSWQIQRAALGTPMPVAAPAEDMFCARAACSTILTLLKGSLQRQKSVFLYHQICIMSTACMVYLIMSHLLLAGANWQHGVGCTQSQRDLKKLAIQKAGAHPE